MIKTFFARVLMCCLALQATMASTQTLSPPEIAAKSYLLLDLTTGQTLAERDANTPSDPASLTKLMTAYVVFMALRDQKINLDQTLPVSMRAWEERKGGGSLMFVEPRMRPKVSDLLRGVIVNSGNDASVVLAEGVGGTLEQFIALMNRQAQVFGMKNTVFKNVTGLTEPGHQSTARDLSIVAKHIIQDFPEFYKLYSIQKYRFEGAPSANENNRNVLLVRDPSVDGMKTGFTESAGYCLIASAQRELPNLAANGTSGGKRRLLSVVLKTASMEARANESQKLLNWGFQAFDTLRLFQAGQTVVTAPLWKGKDNEALLGTEQAVFISVPRGEGHQLQTKIEHPDPLVAPLQKNQAVGTLKVTTAAGTLLAQRPLIVLKAVAQAGLFGRAWDAMRLWIK
jgi:serine-type D-Ala-D-Ala carboxypeptidase (penicillin-binding protein 5/6)